MKTLKDHTSVKNVKKIEKNKAFSTPLGKKNLAKNLHRDYILYC